MTSTGAILKSAIGMDILVEWRIGNFFFLSEEDGAYYSSPDFSFNGVTWSLRIDPNGWRMSRTFGHVNLYLRKQASDSPIKQTFSLSLKTVKGRKEHEKLCTKDFGRFRDFQEFRLFLPRSELSTRHSELLPNGILTIVCIMKSTTSAKNTKGEASNAKVNYMYLESPMAESAKFVASDSNQTGAIKIQESAKSEASGSNQAGTVKTKESVLKWIKEICAEASKGTKRKIEDENVLKWIQENCKETSEGKKRKMEEENSEACTLGSPISPQEKKVLHDLKELFCKKQDCDVVIKVKGSEFPAHRLILKARSPVFASTLQHDMKENATGIVEIEDCDPSYFSDFLHFLYCGDLGMISKENVFALFTAADKYEVLDLKEKCLEFLKKNMTVETFCETITFALQHSETELIELANNFFVKNAKEILSTVKWQTFVGENPAKSNELFLQFVNSVQHGNA